jgi:hypothetical protein
MSIRDFSVKITIEDAALPLEQREVVLAGLAQRLSQELAQYYSGIEVQVEDSFVETSRNVAVHEINSVVSGAYFPVYGV